MNIQLRRLAHALIFVMGLALMILGIVNGKHGATVIGLIVAAVDCQQYIKWNRSRDHTVGA
jgi:hypothetical protein